MYWDLSDGTHRLLQPEEIPGCAIQGDDFTGPISLTYGDTSETRHHLDTISPWVGRRTVGVRISPAGNWDDEFKYRCGQGREFALRIASAAISREAARVGYFTMVCPKFEFPLTVTQFTQVDATVLRHRCAERACQRWDTTGTCH